MKRKIVVLFALCALAIVATSIGSCDKLKNIKGNLAGQLVDSNGTGIGYLSVALINEETGNEVDKQTSNDSGTFFFKEVGSGTYLIKITDIMGNERATDFNTVTLGTGRTKTITIVLAQ